VLGKRVIGLVAPLERDGVCRQLGDQLGLLEDDVAPELHAMSARGDQRVHLLEEVEVDGDLARAATSAAERPRRGRRSRRDRR
jgi:hypothetical protein